MSIKILSIFGTRPEAIKMAPLVKLLDEDVRFEAKVAVTAQHREMLDQVLDFFQIFPDYDLNIMETNQTLVSITNKILNELQPIFNNDKPDIILVHGDTSTTFAASLSAFYNQISIGHVEAGLRTWDKFAPYPEEINRQLTDVLSDLYFAPTKLSKQNLLEENHPEANIFVTGNTAIDAMKYTIDPNYSISDSVTKGKSKIILVTMHRRENIGAPMERILRAIKRLADRYEDIQFIFPMHRNPKVREIVKIILCNKDNVSLIEPLNVVDFHNYAKKSFLILTDSGGVQEEAPSLGIPVLVLRNQTERPEGLEAGTLKLIGDDEERVYSAVVELLTDKQKYNEMVKAVNPYGDGNASLRIVDAIAEYFKRNQ